MAMYMQTRLRRRLKRSGEVFTVLLAAFVVLAPRLDKWDVLEQLVNSFV